MNPAEGRVIGLPRGVRNLLETLHDLLREFFAIGTATCFLLK